MEGRNYNYKQIMSAKATAGVGDNFYCKDYRHMVVLINATVAGGAAVTAKCQRGQDLGTLVQPDMSAAQSSTNIWDYQQMIELSSGNSIDGNDGVVMTANTYKMYSINTDGADYINFILSGISGTVAVDIIVWGYND